MLFVDGRRDREDDDNGVEKWVFVCRARSVELFLIPVDLEPSASSSAYDSKSTPLRDGGSRPKLRCIFELGPAATYRFDAPIDDVSLSIARSRIHAVSNTNYPPVHMFVRAESNDPWHSERLLRLFEFRPFTSTVADTAMSSSNFEPRCGDQGAALLSRHQPSFEGHSGDEPIVGSDTSRTLQNDAWMQEDGRQSLPYSFPPRLTFELPMSNFARCTDIVFGGAGIALYVRPRRQREWGLVDGERMGLGSRLGMSDPSYDLLTEAREKAAEDENCQSLMAIVFPGPLHAAESESASRNAYDDRNDCLPPPPSELSYSSSSPSIYGIDVEGGNTRPPTSRPQVFKLWSNPLHHVAVRDFAVVWTALDYVERMGWIALGGSDGTVSILSVV